jgi:hypothetical protein
MKNLLLPIIVALLFVPTTYGQWESAGSNQPIHTQSDDPIIRYSSTQDLMYMLTADPTSPGVYFLDTMGISSEIWGVFDATLAAIDFIVEDNGNLTFANLVGNDFEMYSMDQSGTPLWSSSSTIPTIGTAYFTQLVQSGSDYYLSFYDGGDLRPKVFKYDGVSWTSLSSNVVDVNTQVSKLEINSLGNPVVHYALNNTTPGSESTTHYFETFESGTWQSVFSTTYLIGTGFYSKGTFCLDPTQDRIYFMRQYDDIIFGPMLDINVINAAVETDLGVDIYVGAETAFHMNIVLDRLAIPRFFIGTQSLGPWGAVVSGKMNSAGEFNTYAEIHGTTTHSSLLSDPRHSVAFDGNNCVYAAYAWDSDFWETSGPNILSAHVQKNCIGTCPYIASENTVVESVSSITSTIGLPVTYQWLDCDSNYAIIPGETNAIYTYLTNGSYAVEVSMNGCVDTSQCTIINDVSIDDLNSHGFVRMGPNPTSGMLTITLDDHISGQLIITDMKGAHVFKSTKQLSGTEQIDLNHLQVGSYLVRVVTRDQTQVFKILKIE